MVETHTYFTELSLELVRTGAGELGLRPSAGAGATVLAGIYLHTGTTVNTGVGPGRPF